MQALNEETFFFELNNRSITSSRHTQVTQLIHVFLLYYDEASTLSTEQ